MVRQQTMGGEGRGFSRFPPLAVGQGESQQPTDSSRSIHEVDLSNCGEVGKKRGRHRAGLFLLSRQFVGNHLAAQVFRQCIGHHVGCSVSLI